MAATFLMSYKIDWTTLSVYENHYSGNRYTDVGDIISVTVPKGKYFVIARFVADFKASGGSNTGIGISCNGTGLAYDHNHGYNGQSQLMTMSAVADATQESNTLTLYIGGQSGTGDIAWGFHITAFRIG